MMNLALNVFLNLFGVFRFHRTGYKHMSKYKKSEITKKYFLEFRLKFEVQ